MQTKTMKPIGKIVDTERPNFSWQPLAGATATGGGHCLKQDGDVVERVRPCGDAETAEQVKGAEHEPRERPEDE